MLAGRVVPVAAGAQGKLPEPPGPTSAQTASSYQSSHTAHLQGAAVAARAPVALDHAHHLAGGPLVAAAARRRRVFSIVLSRVDLGDVGAVRAALALALAALALALAAGCRGGQLGGGAPPLLLGQQFHCSGRQARDDG